MVHLRIRFVWSAALYPTVEELLTLVASNSRKQYRDTLHLSGVIPGSGRMLLKNLGGLEI